MKPLPWEHGTTPEEMVAGAERALLGRADVTAGEVIGVVDGTRMHSGATNFMRLQVVGSEQPSKVDRRKQSRARPAPTLAGPAVPAARLYPPLARRIHG